MSEESRGKTIMGQFEKLKHSTERTNFENVWTDVSTYVLSTRQFNEQFSAGEERRKRQFDATAPDACNRLAAALHGMLTSGSTKWFDLTVDDPDLRDEPEIRLWLDEVVLRLHRIFSNPRFGFPTASHENFLDLCAFGTTIHFRSVEPTGFRFQALPLGGTYFCENERGQVDCLYREFTWTVSQVFEKFGDSNPRIKEKVRDEKLDDEMTLVQAVRPRRIFDPMRRDRLNKPWESVVVMEEAGDIIHEGGFDRFPFYIGLWSKAAGETYGRGPGVFMIPEIRQQNAMARTAIVTAERAANPPIQMPDDGFLKPPRTIPGGVNYYRAGSTARIEPLDLGSNPAVAEAILEAGKQRIERGFFLDLLELPLQDRMTATETIARRNDRRVLLSPALGRTFGGWLQPMVEHTYEDALMMGVFPPMPAIMATANLQVEFVAPLARAMRLPEVNAYEEVVRLLQPFVAVDPLLLNRVFDPDELAAWAKNVNNAPQRLFRNPREARQILAQQQQAQQLQQAVQTGAQGAAGALDAAQAVRQLAEAQGGR